MNNEFSFRLANVAQKKRKRPLVLFFGREEFSDNSKYLYLRALQEQQHFVVIWCSVHSGLINKLQEQGLPCHLISEERLEDTIRLFTSAAVAVFCVNPSQSLTASEELFACLQGARHIQLWHGVSVKQLLLKLTDYLDMADYGFRRPVEFASRASCVLSTAACLDDFFSECFGCQRIIRAGYPRNEVLLRPASALEMIGSELPRDAEVMLNNSKRKKVLFTPTWQRGETKLITGTPRFITRLAQICHDNNIDLFIKSHPLLNGSISRRLMKNTFYLDASLDIYPHLTRFDALITDYSSIMYDYLLTGKPVLRLDIAPGEHRNFEPDYRLVPDIDYAYPWNEENLATVLQQALHNDTKPQQRQQMMQALFESDALEAGNSLIKLIHHEVADNVRRSREFNVEVY